MDILTGLIMTIILETIAPVTPATQQESAPAPTAITTQSTQSDK
jgi:hypothetical protein